jgi:hypothetical protein
MPLWISFCGLFYAAALLNAIERIGKAALRLCVRVNRVPTT